jgi:UPF0716 family protein affecting phage T7 exclusion
MVPGFITDIFGMILLIPNVRRSASLFLLEYFKKRIKFQGTFTNFNNQSNNEYNQEEEIPRNNDNSDDDIIDI